MVSQLKVGWEISIPHSICMPIWQKQIQEITIWSSPSRRYVPKKNIKKFKDLPNIFGVANDILVVGYYRDGKDHDDKLQRVLQICRQVNLKLNKDKCHFRCSDVHKFHFLAKLYPGMVCNLIHRSTKQWWRCPLQKYKKNELPSIPWNN